jgi:hypothetical protein
MTKLLQSLLVGVAGLVAVAVAGPALTKITDALVPLVLVVGIVVAVLRLVWCYTRRW